MNDKKARRVAAGILKAGKTKIWISPDGTERIGQAMTKEDVRALIKDGIIRKRKDKGQSRGRARVLLAKKRRGRKRGRGKRTGTKKARLGGKAGWIKNVRAQRRVLGELKKSGAKFKKPVREIYLMVKGNYFKGKKYLQTMVETPMSPSPVGTRPRPERTSKPAGPQSERQRKRGPQDDGMNATGYFVEEAKK